MFFNSHNSTSQKFRVAIIVVGVLLIIVDLVKVDYGQLLSEENLNEGLGVISNLFLIAAMLVSLRYSARKGENS